MNAEQIKSKIEKWAPQTQAEVTDLTGTQDHYQAVVISPTFKGKLMIAQHRMIYKIFEHEIASGELHALTLKTYTPEQYKK
ncbi:MAG: BolA/IbaG family iron-sulfur metabolism protein [Chlamydiae bacterium]|nr:BolA/IbaG family iron-sulfur metabolism protein [Chlamydiota bacterium]MBI3267240.1 BolA/IbaG family iron-sulfur metabolism protein [Chlamydiota bacterium]